MTRTPVELDIPPLHEKAVRVASHMTVLLIVDLQNEGCHPDGYRYGGHEAEQAVQSTADLLERARASEAMVIWVKSVRTPDQPIFTVYGHDLYRIEGTWGVEFAPPLVPQPGEPVIKKRSHDVFNNTDFEDCLRREGVVSPVWTFIVVGSAFDGCVHEAVTGLSVRDYRVLVPVNCVAPRTGTRALVERYRLGMGAFAYSVTTLTTADLIEFE